MGFSGKGICKYLGGQNGVTVSVVSSCGSILGCGNANVVSTTGIGSSTGTQSIGIGVNILDQSTADDDAEDSDVEISKIDFRGVNLRTKKKRDVSGSQSQSGEKIGDEEVEDGNGCYDGSDASQQQPERPMSWEGELSDQEMSSNTITNQVRALSNLLLFSKHSVKLNHLKTSI